MENKQKKRGRPRQTKTWDAKILQERAREYFNKCDCRIKTIITKNGPIEQIKPIPYSIEGLCCYLDITRQLFFKWRNDNGPLTDRTQKIHLKITANRIEGALEGSQNSAFAQFMLKNNNPEDYKDKMEIENHVDESVVSILEMAVGSWQKKIK